MSDSGKGISEEMELRVMNMLLGEASKQERVDLELELQSNEELKAFYDKMEATLPIAKDGVKALGDSSFDDDSDEPKLNDERREAVLDAIRNPKFEKPASVAKEVEKPSKFFSSPLVAVGSVAACLTIGGFFVWDNIAISHRLDDTTYSVDEVAFEPIAEEEMVALKRERNRAQVAKELYDSRNEADKKAKLEGEMLSASKQNLVPEQVAAVTAPARLAENPESIRLSKLAALEEEEVQLAQNEPLDVTKTAILGDELGVDGFTVEGAVSDLALIGENVPTPGEAIVSFEKAGILGGYGENENLEGKMVDPVAQQSLDQLGQVLETEPLSIIAGTGISGEVKELEDLVQGELSVDDSSLMLVPESNEELEMRFADNDDDVFVDSLTDEAESDGMMQERADGAQVMAAGEGVSLGSQPLPGLQVADADRTENLRGLSQPTLPVAELDGVESNQFGLVGGGRNLQTPKVQEALPMLTEAPQAKDESLASDVDLRSQEFAQRERSKSKLNRSASPTPTTTFGSTRSVSSFDADFSQPSNKPAMPPAPSAAPRPVVPKERESGGKSSANVAGVSTTRDIPETLSFSAPKGTSYMFKREAQASPPPEPVTRTEQGGAVTSPESASISSIEDDKGVNQLDLIRDLEEKKRVVEADSVSMESLLAAAPQDKKKRSPQKADEGTVWSLAEPVEAPRLSYRAKIQEKEKEEVGRQAGDQLGLHDSQSDRLNEVARESNFGNSGSGVTLGKKLPKIKAKPAPVEESLEEKLQKKLAEEREAGQGIALGRRLEVEDRKAPARPTRRYAPLPEMLTSERPDSTFSLNVSDVSYRLAAEHLNAGRLPPPSSIRSEEFINAFNYRDPIDLSGNPVSINWELAREPFAHNRTLLRFAVQTAAQGRERNRPLNLVLAIDSSGSMSREDRQRVVQGALQVLADKLQPKDMVSVVSFARDARLTVDGKSGGDWSSLLNPILAVNAQGATNLESGIELAYETAQKHYLIGGNNRVILFTDGVANLGNVIPESLQRLVVANRKKGIALDCFGVGLAEYDDSMLEILSRNGDGRYGFINNLDDLKVSFAKRLLGALEVAAEDVKVQVVFNPKRVSSYRQIGYKQHQLKKEDFLDNTVDAAELGAAESGNALYSLAIDENGTGPIGVIQVRYRDPKTKEYKLNVLRIDHQRMIPLFRAASPAMRLAATAAQFAETLAQNPYAVNVNIDDVLMNAQRVKDFFVNDPEPQKLENMIRQAIPLLK